MRVLEFVACAVFHFLLLCRVVDEGVQLHGGAGYMDEYPISRMYTDARVTRIFAGSSELMKLIISRDFARKDYVDFIDRDLN